MLTLILFALGGSTGMVVATAADQKTHLGRFNTVSVGILGALFGGLGLPRILHDALPFDRLPTFAPLLCAALTAIALTIILNIVRRRFVA